MTAKPLVAGVGMTPFQKPGKSEPWDVMAVQAVKAAVEDASIPYADVEQAYVGFVYCNTTSGQTALYQVGLTGIPIIHVTNACATGSTALFLARQAVEAGIADVALALGFEQMVPGALHPVFTHKPPKKAWTFASCADRRPGHDFGR